MTPVILTTICGACGSTEGYMQIEVIDSILKCRNCEADIIIKAVKPINNKARLKRLIYEYKNTCVELSWMGGNHPDTWEDTKQDARDAKRKLFTFINEM